MGQRVPLYALEMMRCLREINVDNNTVGWYQSTYLGSYYTEVGVGGCCTPLPGGVRLGWLRGPWGGIR
jgi:hypothetical protein